MEYSKARKQAQELADRLGMDVGISSSYEGYSYRILPRRENRTGHELRKEVVHPTTGAKPGHGPGPVANGWLVPNTKKIGRHRAS